MYSGIYYNPRRREKQEYTLFALKTSTGDEISIPGAA